MKSFDEWFEDNYGCLDMLGTRELEKDYAKLIWQAAQEVQRESDADIAWCFNCDKVSEKIRNNKAV